LRRIKQRPSVLARPVVIGYAFVMNRLMTTRLAALLCLALLGLSLGGCTKCGWLWNDQGPGTCHSDTPR
jgi:hypothetical protein